MGNAVMVGDTATTETKDDKVVLELFQHLSREYDRKMTELMSHGELKLREVEMQKKLFLKAIGLMPSLEKPMQEKALQLIGDDELIKASRQSVPEGTTVTSKVVQQFGDPHLLPDKAKDRIGDEMTASQMQAMKQAALQEKLEAFEKSKAELAEVLKQKPSEELKQLPVTDKPIRNKALDMIGDTDLEEQAKKLVAKETLNAKAIKLAGNADQLAPKKAASMLGDEMNQKQVNLLIKSEKAESDRKKSEHQHQLKELLKRTPSECQLELNHTVNSKAVDKLGVEVAHQTLRLIPDNSEVTQKGLKILGDKALLQGKAGKLAGSDMKQEQVIAMRRAEEEEQRRVASQKKKEMDQVISQKPDSEVLAIPKNIQNRKVAMKKFGDEMMPEKAAKRLGQPV